MSRDSYYRQFRYKGLYVRVEQNDTLYVATIGNMVQGGFIPEWSDRLDSPEKAEQFARQIIDEYGKIYKKSDNAVLTARRSA